MYPGQVGIKAFTVIQFRVSSCSWWKVSSTAKDLTIVCFLVYHKGEEWEVSSVDVKVEGD